jgi:hypothetical protein
MYAFPGSKLPEPPCQVSLLVPAARFGLIGEWH